MPEVRVQPHSVYEHHLYIQKSNTTLNWTFSTEKNSICFGLYYRPDSQQTTTRKSSSDSSKGIKKRNMSLPPPPLKISPLLCSNSKSTNSTPTAAAEEQQHTHYFSDTDDNNQRHSITQSVRDSARSNRKSSSTISVVNLLNNDWLNFIRAKRNAMNANNNMIWDHDTTRETEGIESAISLLLPELEITDDNISDNLLLHKAITKGLEDIDGELKVLKNLIQKDLVSLLNHDSYTVVSSPTATESFFSNSSIIAQPPPPHTSSSSTIKLRFPFKRISSSTNLEEYQQKTTSPASVIMMEKISQSIKLLTEYKDQVSTAYFENYNSSNTQHLLHRPGTGFLSHRSASFYSYSAQSDQFFDAEDFLLSNEENELTYGSILIDSEDEERDSSSSLITMTPQLDDLTISRRTKLPHPVVIRNVSVLGILRKNIGKDLSTISMPISLNEPINLLQRLCEELEYCELLDKASTQESSMDRLMYVTAFAISGYASSQYRIARKPFNPLMCETYECIRPDKGFRFISENVSHYPNVMACHAKSKKFQYRQSYFGKTKFWELITEGSSHITLNGYPDDQYTYTRPSSWLRNLVTGTKYLGHIGEMKVNNHSTGEYAIVTFKEAANTNSSFFGSSNVMHRNNVVAKFYDCRGTLIREVEGKWSDILSEAVGPDQYAVIWRSKPPSIPDYQDYYGLTQFTMEMNEITSVERGKLPITDTRLRSDQSLFENGRVAEAEDEQFQRERRKQFEVQNKPWDPLWFELKQDKYSTTGESWQYKGGYWEARNSGQWSKEILQLW